MGRGGARRGAGRPTTRDLWDRMSVGAYCGRLRREAGAERDAKRLRQVLGDDAADTVERAHGALRRVPKEHRQVWSKTRPLGAPLPNNGGTIDGHIYDVRWELGGRPKDGDPETVMLGDDVGRMLRGQPRQRAPRAEIIAKVAAELGLDERYVRQCWDEWRVRERDLERDDPDPV